MSDQKHYRTGKNNTADDKILLIFYRIPGIGIRHRSPSRGALLQLLTEAEIKIDDGKNKGDQCNNSRIPDEIPERIAQ